MKSNFFNPNQMISNTSQKIVLGFLYASMISLGGIMILFSMGYVDENIWLTITTYSMIGIISCIGIWWHEVSKPT